MLSQKALIESMLIAFKAWQSDHEVGMSELSKDEFLDKMAALYFVQKQRKFSKGRQARFVISTRVDGDKMFNLVAPNNKIIATSEGYKSVNGCVNGIEAIQEYAPIAEIIIKEDGVDKQ